ncbi:hypothetical protein KUV80_11835 [Fictibacillus nanhaiensis]|uniref:hypothetical protein n=1 Tax=Fictibacillus nanhaiensis TaxID=742169 RepID=UPI001C969D95|nr:hypothetical protein [Fictibacillus nanhaiensis]MBY6037353.1 hypothetical protein [Fictibacillus nanhaiensis]
MHPTEIIEIMTVGGFITIIIITSFFLKGKYRKAGLSLVAITLLSFCVLFIVRPLWIDTQIKKKVNLLTPYLVEHYPKERWTISTVPHREEGFKHLNPYYIGVVFENEPEVTYHYWVKNKNNISQSGVSTKSVLTDLKHKEQKTR